jgi:hypothetical protein
MSATYVLSKPPAFTVVKPVSLSHTSSGFVTHGPPGQNTKRSGSKMSPGAVVGELLDPKIPPAISQPPKSGLEKWTPFPEPVTSMVVVPVFKKSTGTANAACPASSARAVRNSNFFIEYVPPFQFPMLDNRT